jgi:hypothetical protein
MLRDECTIFGVPFFFKQWGEWFPRDQWEHNPGLVLPGDDVAYDPAHAAASNCHWITNPIDGVAVMHRVGKARAGRVLDGQFHDAFPTVNRRTETCP